MARDLARLDDVEDGLGQQALAYVCVGHNDSVLAALSRKKAKIGSALGYSHGWSTGPVKVDGRKEFFFQMRKWDAALVRRYGQVLAIAAADAGVLGRQYMPGTEQSPAWFRVLLYEVARMSNSAYGVRAGAAETRGPFTIARLQELLALDGGGAEPIFDAAFDHGSGWQYWYADRLDLAALAGFTTLLRDTPEPVLRAIRGHSADGRANAIRTLASLDMISGPYFDLAYDCLTDGSKKVRQAASAALHGVVPPLLMAKAETVLASGKPNERHEVIRLLASALGGDATALLERHAAKEESKKVAAEIEAILRRTKAPPSSGAEAAFQPAALDAPDEPDKYRAADGSLVPIPSMAELPADTDVPASVRDALRAYLQSRNEAAVRHNREQSGQKHFFKRPTFPLSVADEFCAFIGPGFGRSGAAEAQGKAFQVFDATTWQDREFKLLSKIFGDPGITLWHLVRASCSALGRAQRWAVASVITSRTALSDAMRRRLSARYDLRIVSRIAETTGLPADTFMCVMLADDYWRPSPDETPADILWPYLTEHLAIVDEALGLAPASGNTQFSELYALEVLAVLPKLPARYLGVVLDRATGERKTLRRPARTLLSNITNIDGLIVPLLADSKQEVRVGAAEWLAERGTRAAIEPLKTALAKEKQEAPKAAFLTALSRLGESIEPFVSREALIGEAQAGLSKVKSKDLDWFPFGSLPALHWQDGQGVDPTIVRWWIVLANKLKQPAGNPLFEIYLDRLSQESAEALGSFMIQAFVARDTITPTEAEANAFARANAQARHQSYVRWVKDYTIERAFAELRATKLAEYSFSVTDNKGILGLATRAKAVDAVAMVRAYMRDHYPRTAQCKALVECLAGNPSPTAIQFVLSIANRYRTKGVKEHAAALVQEIADRRGWSPEQLADRTIPTAGLDEAGMVELPVGDRTYSARLDAEGKLALFNPQGRSIQSLPSSSEGADAEALAAAKKTLSTARKEAKQARDFQQRRLYEALCTERCWGAEEWATYLLRHPIVGRLVQRLIWVGLDSDKRVLATFRPMEDLSLTDAADAAVDLASFAEVRLAHRSLLTGEQATAWLRHLQDYKIVPLFEQLERPLLTLSPAHKDATAIVDRRGWLIEAFKLRGGANKLGYNRGAAEDGGFFTTYLKPFDALQIAAVIEFTGNSLPEENRSCALLSLKYLPKGKSGDWRFDRPVPLSGVPRVLLSETWNDLHVIAEAGSGFAADWEKRAQW